MASNKRNAKQISAPDVHAKPWFSRRFILIGTVSSIVAAVGLALLETAVGDGWREGATGALLDATVFGITVAVVFAMAGILLRLLDGSPKMPMPRVVSTATLGATLGGLTLVLGLVVLAVRPETGLDSWAHMLITAVTGGFAGALLVLRANSRRWT
jgi:drug/metabolite transporter (DMT)-like permease